MITPHFRRIIVSASQASAFFSATTTVALSLSFQQELNFKTNPESYRENPQNICRTTAEQPQRSERVKTTTPTASAN